MITEIKIKPGNKKVSVFNNRADRLMQTNSSYVWQLTSRAKFLEQKDWVVEIQKVKASFNRECY